MKSTRMWLRMWRRATSRPALPWCVCIVWQCHGQRVMLRAKREDGTRAHYCFWSLLMALKISSWASQTLALCLLSDTSRVSCTP